jgi:hypothetical protein
MSAECRVLCAELVQAASNRRDNMTGSSFRMVRIVFAKLFIFFYMGK